MKDNPRKVNEQAALALFLTKWSILGAWVGLLAGAASALFLWLLDLATHYREHHAWLIFFLPVAGVAIALIYARYGREVAAGNNLLLERIHDPQESIPFRMAPLVLVTTVVTHLFGGSAGREGTAVQMGGTLAGLAAAPLRLSKEDHSILLMTGIAAGFGSVFGTPLAGAVFGLEVLSIGRIRYNALVPCLVGSFVGDLVCRALGITHHVYLVPDTFAASPAFFAWVLVAGVLFAGASALFTEATHFVQQLGRKLKHAAYVRAFAGGLAIIALTLAVGSQEYNGLSLPLLERTFTSAEIPIYAFLLKILFTSITLGAGFKGGEVTPLFVIGAALGHALATLTGQPTAVFAALGFVAVFAGAANTPLACTIMGIELFGSHLTMPLAFACVIAYILSGHRGIYVAQRVHQPKTHLAEIEPGSTLEAVKSDGFHVARPLLRRFFTKGKNNDE